VLAVREDLETRWRELGEYIRDQRRLDHLSLRKLSEMAGISNPYLSQIERGLRKPSAEILQQIARALQISSETLYVRAGILDPDDSSDGRRAAGVVDAVLLDPALNERQKRVLLDVYASFVRENTSPDDADEPAPARPAAKTTAKKTPASKRTTK
jgi:transcriptional regulator with XRE-family HTH domain